MEMGSVRIDSGPLGPIYLHEGRNGAASSSAQTYAEPVGGGLIRMKYGSDIHGSLVDWVHPSVHSGYASRLPLKVV